VSVSRHPSPKATPYVYSVHSHGEGVCGNARSPRSSSEGGGTWSRDWTAAPGVGSAAEETASGESEYKTDISQSKTDISQF
jgi:hypothetical protein